MRKIYILAKEIIREKGMERLNLLYWIQIISKLWCQVLCFSMLASTFPH